MRELMLGIGLGLGAGVAPGALLGLVITASLRGGFPAGLRMACVPLLSDLPVVVLSIVLAGALPSGLLRGLSIAGGLYVVYLGAEAVMAARTAVVPAPGEKVPSQVGKGVLVNLTNPHPWLFWITVGGPLVVAAWEKGVGPAAAFMIGFYLLLVGAKVVLAGLVAAGRHRLGPRAYRATLAASGLLLAGAGVWLVVQGVTG
ncbi:LysE family translocator [Herbidospora galbida]|uniref:LysE family translocator n=1 Tax=Herbidospora galbida TaxID=2575442 RepID=A0A4U3MEP7_9ACTN|nr:LysE family transporter [Herbidospora galbida]TKK86989.1 LysE family translocator [Herbidospora galbida]